MTETRFTLVGAGIENPHNALELIREPENGEEIAFAELLAY